MIEMYRYIKAEKINTECVLINQAEDRMFYFDCILFFSLGLLLIIQVFSYNHQDIGEIIFTTILLMITLTLIQFKNRICHKTIKFNRKEGTIEFKRTLPNIHEVYPFSKVDIVCKKIDFIDEDGYRFNHKSYFLQLQNTTTKYLICKSGPNASFDVFINKYMNSDKQVIENLMHYKREEDEALKKVFHM